MKKIIPLTLLILTIITGCGGPENRHVMYSGRSYSNFSKPGIYYPQTKRFLLGVPATSEDKLEEAFAIAKQLPENTRLIVKYSHTEFSFASDVSKLKLGKPVGVSEFTEEEAMSLLDGVRFTKAEQFNADVEFQGYSHTYNWRNDTSFTKSDYVTKQEGSGGIFYSDAKQAIATWFLPVVGSDIRIRHQKWHADSKYLTTIFFHDYDPRQEVVITFKIPKWLDIDFVERNFEGYDIKRTDSVFQVGKKDVPKPLSKPVASNKTSSMPAPKQKAKVNVKPDNEFRYVTYKLTNARQLKPENLFPGHTHDLPHLLVLTKGIDSVGMAKYIEARQNGKTKNKAKQQPPAVKTPAKKGKENNKTATLKEHDLKQSIANTKDLYNWCVDIAKRADNNIDTLKPIVQEIVKGKTTDKEKIEAVFYWVQDNIRYVAFEDGLAAFKPDACQNVLVKRYGDCKGMANLIKCMLVSIGLDARLTWIGTHRLNIDYTIPSIATSNHMICAIQVDGKWCYLDGTEKFIALNDYAHRIQGRPVMIENGADYIIDTVPSLPYNRNEHKRTAKLSIKENGVITGKITEVISGENKTSFLYKYHYTEKAKQQYFIKNYLRDWDENIIITNANVSNLNDRKSDIKIDYDLEVLHNAVKDNKRLLIKPDFIGEFTNHVQDTNRMSKLAYGHKIFYHHQYEMQLPKGYSVKELPKPFMVQTKDYRFEINFKLSGGVIVYEKQLILYNGYVSKQGIKQWNTDVKNLNNAYQSYIVLSKN